MHVTIGPGGVVTIPKDVRDRLMMPEGDECELRVTPEGVLIVPVPGRDPDQWWFWTDEWQAGEREVEKEKATHVPRYLSAEEFIAELQRISDETSVADEAAGRVSKSSR